MRLLLIPLTLAVSGAASVALADPCTAIPERGATPSYVAPGLVFSGPVAHVVDGDGLCVAVGQDPSSWVEVRLADFYAPELSSRAGVAAKAALERVAMGKHATCVAGLRAYDRIAARCRIDGVAVGDLMRSAGVREGGNAMQVVNLPDTPPVAASTTEAFPNCAAARAAGAAPIRRGDARFGPHLDEDGDGVACEPLPAGASQPSPTKPDAPRL